MKVEKREHGITLVPENEFEREALKELRIHSIKKMNFEDSWKSIGKFLIEYNDRWD